MAKDLLSEQQLLEIINTELAKHWAHKDSSCDVRNLRQINLPERNWEVEHWGASKYIEECDALRQRVLEELVPKYNVLWSELLT